MLGHPQEKDVEVNAPTKPITIASIKTQRTGNN